MAQKRDYRILGLFTVLMAPCSWALDLDYTLYSSAEYTDNIRQSGTDENVSGNILRGGIAFAVGTDEGAPLAADVMGDFSRIHYSDGGLDAEDRKNLDATVLWRPRGTNFQLTALNSLRQVQEDRRATRTVNNIRDYNIFTIVPAYHFDLTTRSRINTSYSYSIVSDQLDRSSRDVATATVGYEYKVSNLSDWSLNVSRSNIEFTDTGQELDQESAYFRWIYSGRVTSWMLDLGRQRIIEAQNAEANLINLSVARQINRFSSLGLFYSEGYSDVVDNIVGGRLTALVPNAAAIYADELALEKQLALSYGFDRGNLEGRARLEARRLESEEAVSIGYLVDEDRYIFNLGMDYRFPTAHEDLSRYGLGAWYRYVDERFNLDGLENRINEAAVRVNYFATRSTMLFFELRSRHTSGTGPMSNTDENAGMIGIRFSPTGGY